MRACAFGVTVRDCVCALSHVACCAAAVFRTTTTVPHHNLLPAEATPHRFHLKIRCVIEGERVRSACPLCRRPQIRQAAPRGTNRRPASRLRRGLALFVDRDRGQAVRDDLFNVGRPDKVSALDKLVDGRLARKHSLSGGLAGHALIALEHGCSLLGARAWVEGRPVLPLVQSLDLGVDLRLPPGRLVSRVGDLRPSTLGALLCRLLPHHTHSVLRALLEGQLKLLLNLAARCRHWGLRVCGGLAGALQQLGCHADAETASRCLRRRLLSAGRAAH
mmetsp:Transcript_7763/g.25441  ORF Transcript_7763/g.25441 Transcript_7763/m.25441 type:complete len:276 (-) Transcript_7763:32-859(-)